jgi:hypothetical protein
MSFGFRKGFSSGPFRMTFSKRGLSMSVGAGGARITAGPRGTHVSFSKGGFYYRTRLDRPQSRAFVPEPSSIPEPVENSNPIPELPVETPPSVPPPEVFGDTTPDAVVAAMNKRIKRWNLSLPIGAVISGGLFAASVPWPIAAAVGVLSTLLALLQHRRSMCSTLVYGNEEETAHRLERLHKAVAALRSADSVWSVREASVRNGLSAHPPTLNRVRVADDPPPLPKYLRTNIVPAALHLADGTIYFFPDRLFVWHSGRFSALDYHDVKLRFSRVTFLERERQPPDAAVESKMRRSHSDESTFPVLYYGLAEFDASPALTVELMTSRTESAQEFIDQMRAITGGTEQALDQEAKEPLYTHFDPVRVPLYYNLTEEALGEFQAIRKAFSILVKLRPRLAL